MGVCLFRIWYSRLDVLRAVTGIPSRMLFQFIVRFRSFLFVADVPVLSVVYQLRNECDPPGPSVNVYVIGRCPVSVVLLAFSFCWFAFSLVGWRSAVKFVFFICLLDVAEVVYFHDYRD